MITFNGIPHTNYTDIVSVQNINRPAHSGSRARTMEIVGRDGVYYFGKDRRPENVSFRLTLKSESLESRRSAIRAIAGWLETDDVRVLSFDDEPGVIYHAVLVDPIMTDEFVLNGFLDVSFLIPDGVAFSTTLVTVSQDGGELTFTNSGTEETPAYIEAEIMEETNSLTIALTEKEYIEIEYDFGVGDTIEIDGQARTIYLGDTDLRQKETLASRIFTLPPPGGKLMPDPVSTKLYLAFRERYL